jgi:hypothetical protein
MCQQELQDVQPVLNLLQGVQLPNGNHAEILQRVWSAVFDLYSAAAASPAAGAAAAAAAHKHGCWDPVVTDSSCICTSTEQLVDCHYIKFAHSADQRGRLARLCMLHG